MPLNFTDERYFRKAMELAKAAPESQLSAEDAFLMLVKDVPACRLDNLLKRAKQSCPEATEEELYDRIQGRDAGVKAEKFFFLPYAYDILSRQIPLGSETVPGTNINTSDWIGHSLWEAKACATLAGARGLDTVRAFNLGLLHDIGRKEIHTFEHTVRGFEMLTDLGMNAEALGCLTHSFINGGRCASNEKAEPGFFVTEEGLPCWAPDAVRDEITLFLEAYRYTDYDRILNLADLMATGKNIVPPAERIRDIATRRTLDPVNRGYFLAELISLCAQWLEKPETVHFTKECTIAEMEQQLETVSSHFWERFSKMDMEPFDKVMNSERNSLK